MTRPTWRRAAVILGAIIAIVIIAPYVVEWLAPHIGYWIYELWLTAAGG